MNIRSHRHVSHWHLLDFHPRNHSPCLIPLPPPPFPSADRYAPVSLGHKLFLLGGFIEDFPSPVVQIYDARFNCWHVGPPMLSSRVFADAGVISGRIYVVGSHRETGPLKNCLAEEFDPKK